MKKMIAFDFGATSGRGIVGTFDGNRLSLEEFSRFSNPVCQIREHIYVDFLSMYSRVCEGLMSVFDAESLGICSWSADFALFDKYDMLICNPLFYRGGFSQKYLLKLFKLVERREIFRSTGTQVNQIRTLSTLFAISTAYPQIMERAAALLHLPDALNFLLTGEKRTEYSVASISMAFNNVTRCWNYNLLKKVGIKDSIFQKVVPSGTIVGRTNIEKVKNGPLVVSVCSHDTMNAFLAIPSPRGSRRAFISCGTMALISVERDKSDITDKAYTTEYGNNGGFEGKIGFTRSIAGLWIYEKVKEEYERGEGLLDYRLLDSEVQAASSFSSFIDPDNALFFPPGEMTSRIDFFCRKTGQAMPSNRGAYFRCILESLAIKYRIALENLEEILGYKLEALHVVGGGSKNQLLMQNIADATGSPVYTGPVEATAAGNLAIQLYAAGECRNRWEIKEIIARSFPLKEFLPKNKEIWQEACFKFKTIIIEETNFIEGDKT